LDPLSSNANVGELWNCLINKYPAYENLYTPSEEFNDKGFLILNLKQAGYCQVCEKDHGSSGAYLFIEGEEETILLDCYRKEQYKPDDKYKFIISLKPKESKGKLQYIPYITAPIEADYAIYHSGVSAKTKQQDYFTNVDKVWSCVQNVPYSPTCTVGTSYKGKDFDNIFILAG